MSTAILISFREKNKNQKETEGKGETEGGSRTETDIAAGREMQCEMLLNT